MRPALEDACRRGIDQGRLLVVAGAGYGKSTLLAQVVGGLAMDWAWCSCDRRTASPAALVAHLSAAIEERVPGFGAELRPVGGAEEVTAAFCNELDLTVSDDLLLVLDDIHLLQGTSAEVIPGLLIDDLPPVVRLVLSGRSTPLLAAGRLSPSAVLIDDADLALAPEEAEALLQGAGLSAPPGAMRALHASTEGWAAGLLIAAQARAQAPPG